MAANASVRLEVLQHRPGHVDRVEGETEPAYLLAAGVEHLEHAVRAFAAAGEFLDLEAMLAGVFAG